MKIGGQILWNVTPIFETSQISYLMGKRPMKNVLGNHLKDLLFHLVHWLNCEGSVANPSIWKKILPGLFLGYALAGEIWKGDVLVADLEELETMDASEIYSIRLDAKEVIFPIERENSYFQSQMDEKIVRGHHELRTSTLIREHPIRGEGHVDFLGESEGSLPPPPQDSLLDAGEARNDFLVHFRKLHRPPSR